ncbi:MAG: gamma-glutamyl-gamma-aminobutyrate hydrolase family protein [Bacillota bacterium]|jgi:putative glutamine amidotransferase
MKILGIVCGKTGDNFVMRKYYTEMFTAFGIGVVLLPVGAAYNISKLDGIVLAGGGDIHSALFGAEVIPELRNVDLERDIFEIEICRRAVKAGLAVFGICRGMQILNVALGGTLIQNLDEKRLRLHDENNHRVLTVGAGFAKTAACQCFAVNSYHHQAVDKISKELRPVLYSEDGITEGVSGTENNRILGLQFHPERIYGKSTAVWKIIEDFCRKI